jgi:outer membrane protein assembly factor BamB
LRTLTIALLLALLTAAPAEARVHVSRVSASPTATGVQVRFTITHRGKARVTITLRGATTARVRRTVTVHRRRRVSIRARVASGSWKVTVCATARHHRSCGHAVKVVVKAAPAPAPAPGLGETRNLHVDAAHTNALDVPSPAPPLRERWRTDDQPTSALVAGGRVFTLGERGITARDERTGAILWRQDVGGKGMAYDNGRVFVVGDGIAALDAQTGARVWHVPSDEAQSTPPVTDGGELYASIGLAVTRYDEATGAVVWTRATRTWASRAPSLDATRVWAGNSCVPLLRSSGEPAGPPIDPCPNDAASLVAPLAAGHILLTDFERSGAWMDYDATANAFTGTAASNMPPAVAGGTAIAVDYQAVTAFTFPGWSPRWVYNAPEPDHFYNLPPLVVGRHIYIADDDYHLRALSLDTGALEWTAMGPYFAKYEPGSFVQAMAVGDGLLLVPTMLGMIAYESA